MEQKTIEMQAEEKARQSNQGWFSYFFGSSQPEEERKLVNEQELQKLYNVLQANMDREPSASEEPKLARTEEYYWLVGDFYMAKGTLKIQRDTLKPDKGKFKEAIVLTVENIGAKFQKRFKGFDADIRVGSTVLSTYSSLGKKNRISNIILSRNPLGPSPAQGDLAVFQISTMHPNSDTQLEVDTSIKSLRIYYLPLLIGRTMMFLGREEARSTTLNALSEIRSNTQGSIQAALEGKKSRISVFVESPAVIVPILKNNDPASPVWCIRLGDIHLDSNV